MRTIPRRCWGWVKRRPLSWYRYGQDKRDWLLAKIEYANAESAKWRTIFNVCKSPYSFLRAMGFSPQMAAGLLFAGTTVGGGVIVNETLLDGPSFQRGDSGVYQAPSDAPIFYSEENNTLRVDLGSTPVGALTIENVSVGTAVTGSTLPVGQTDVVLVGGLAAGAGFTETFIETTHLIITRFRCDSFDLSETEAHTLNIKYNASDGQSIGPTPGTPRARAVGGGNRADSMITSGGTYDQIRIQAPTSGVNGKVDIFTLSNIFTKGGPCKFSRIKAGTIDVLLNETGLGNGFATKEFVIATSTVYKIFGNVDNVEVTISPP